jgi:hypothetical protein
MLTSPLFKETFGAFPFFLFFLALSLQDLGVLMIFEEKITSSKTSFQMTSIYWRWTHNLEWMYARQYLWVRLAINVGGKSFSTNFKTQIDTSLNKAQHKQKLLCE